MSHTEIAIVGMAGRFLGADCVVDLSRSLINGHEAVGKFDADEGLAARVPDRLVTAALGEICGD